MGTKIDYLRFSVIDKCNLNCLYCTPMKKNKFLAIDEILKNEEIVKIIKIFVKLGIKNLRLTGGEPLVKKDIVNLVAMIKSIDGLENLSITTNGVYLKNFIYQLKQAGLDRINISLDSLKKDRFKYITGFDYLNEIWTGIEKSLESGLYPIKLNVILMKGINDDEIIDFVHLSIKHHLIVRFIEFFPANDRVNNNYLIKNEEVKKRIIEYFGSIQKNLKVQGKGPAEYYNVSTGIIGFISSVSRNFCNECNRIRIDYTGKLFLCLFSKSVCNLKLLLQNNDNDILDKINKLLMIKSQKKEEKFCCSIEMSNIGG